MSSGRGGGLFTLVTNGIAGLTTLQQLNLGKIQQEGTVVSTMIVEVANVKDLQQGGVINLQMPGKDCTAQVKAKSIESYSNGDYTWYGEVEKENGETEEACSCYDGIVTLISRSGRLFGTIRIDEDHWSLHDLGGGKRTLVQRDFTENGLGCSMPDSGEESLSNSIAQDRTYGNCPVRVLALYTPNALAAAADLEDRIEAAFVDANQALRNSKISPNGLTLILHGIEPFEFTESNDIRSDLNNLIPNSTLLARRNDTRADLVILYTNGNYTLGGVARLGPSIDSALCIVNKIGENLYTTAHELAHLFGCRHDLEDDPEGTYEHGYNFKTGCWPFRDKRETIMVSPVTNNRILHFSNPNVYYKGKSTGTDDSENNARLLRTNACTVASFREDAVNAPFRVIPSSGQEACPCAYVVFTVSGIGGGPGPYQFEWFTSTDGFNYGPLEGIGNTFDVFAPCTIGANLHIKVKGTSADGQVDEGFTYVIALDPGSPSNCDRNQTTALQQELVMLFPNPVQEFVTLAINSPTTAAVSITLTDALGRLLSARHFTVGNGQTSHNQDTSALIPGMYFMEIKVGDQLIAKKIIKN